MTIMSRASRLLTAAAALLLGALYFTPLWSIRLVAPQYPEGLGMLIGIRDISGMKENDLHSINGLNHYIGMRPIEAAAIPELRYMPWIVAGLIATGLIVALVGRRRLLAVWMFGFAALGVAGLYDFWRWGYDYGHNLDAEQAIIAVPGMSYQPPLLGSKQLLNFTATSWPAAGGILAGLAFALGAAALVLAYRRRPSASGLGAALLAASVACTSGTQSLRLGVDVCAECRMLVTDARFGARVVTHTSKVLTFDSIDCMRKHLAGIPASDVRDVWLADAAHPGSLVRAGEATLLDDESLHPPMGTTYARAAYAR